MAPAQSRRNLILYGFILIDCLGIGWYLQRNISATSVATADASHKPALNSKLIPLSEHRFSIPENYAERVGLKFGKIKCSDQPQLLPALEAILVAEVDPSWRNPVGDLGKTSIVQNAFASQRLTKALVADRSRINQPLQLQVWAMACEEELSALQSLPMPYPWKISLSGEVAPTSTGELRHIKAILDPDQHTAWVTGIVHNETGLLRAGQSVMVTVTIPPNPDELLLPAEAVIEDGPASIVFVLNETNSAVLERQFVHVVSRNREYVVLQRGRDGLHAGQKVVTRGALLLQHALNKQQIHSIIKTHPSEPTVP